MQDAAVNTVTLPGGVEISDPHSGHEGGVADAPIELAVPAVTRRRSWRVRRGCATGTRQHCPHA
eukprot:8461098-Prorocentrum_lima.AAC.1